MELPEEEYDKILKVLLQKGVDSTDLSMFDENFRFELLRKASERFFGDKNYAEAIKACKIIRDKDKLNKLGDAFLKSGLLSNALYVYEAAGNATMVDFIKQNFNEDRYKNKIYI